jgi:gliding motility-associatede transport system auxiliary component
MALMKNDYRRYALIGLIVALLSLLAGVGVLIAKGLASANLYVPSNPTLINQIGIGALAGFVLGLAIYAIIDPEKARKFLTGRQAQYGSNSIIMLLAFIGIVVVVNMIVYQNPKRWDVTEDRSNTLAAETIDALQKIPQTISVTAFYSPSLDRTSATKLLDEFKTGSNGKITYKFIDPVSNPGAAQSAGVTSDGSLLLQMGEEHQLVTSVSEQELTSAVIRLMNPQKRIIYFLTGEGERDTETSDNAAYTQVRSALETRNYIVKTLNLQAENSIPSDTKVIVVAGPLKPLSQDNVNLLDAFLTKGGSLIVMEDPIPATQFGDSADPLADYLTTKWGITLNNDMVIDPNSPSNPAFAVAYQYASHPITNKMQNLAAIFPVARSLTTTSQPSTNVTVTGLVLTADTAWGERDFQSIQNNQVSFDAQTDIKGPMTLVAAAEDSTTKARLVVFGNSSFVVDSNFSAYGNSNFMTNTMDWAAGEENLISLTSKQAITRQFKPPSSLLLITIVLVAGCVLPLVVVGAGVASWVARRRRG